MTAEYPFEFIDNISFDQAHIPATGGSVEPPFPGTIPLIHPHINLSPPTSTPAPKSSPDSDNCDERNTIHFIDHTDKKSALRIRNTRISRAHRDNKLKRIQDLEKKLAACEAEKAMWKGRAIQMGWRQ